MTLAILDFGKLYYQIIGKLVRKEEIVLVNISSVNISLSSDTSTSDVNTATFITITAILNKYLIIINKILKYIRQKIYDCFLIKNNYYTL